MEINLDFKSDLDQYFKVVILSATEKPDKLCYQALHQCYAENFIAEENKNLNDYGKIVNERCVKFGHYGILEHPSITFNVGYFPHNVMVQSRTHRHLSFSVQSQRYTGKRILEFFQDNSQKEIEFEKLFYFRKPGFYKDRSGNLYEYTLIKRQQDIKFQIEYLKTILKNFKGNNNNEFLRDYYPQNIRQHFVVTMNARSLMHFCDLRLPSDAQLEIQELANIFLNIFKKWMPKTADWYIKNRAGKNKLAP
jgi:thymidylate synthase (FAD)